MASTEIEIKILTDIGKSTKDIANFQSKTQASVQKIQKSFSVLNGVILGIGAAFAGRAILNGINSVVEAASRQEDAINKLNTALKISGNFSQEASQDIQDFASSLQQITTFGDEAILETSALIQSLGQLSGQGLKDATAATLDLSAALGVDLNAAALLVGKAASGEIGSFSRYGLVIKRGADNAETFANALDAINSKFGGAAAAQVQTFSGATTQLSNSFGDLLEEFGFAITESPQIISLFGSINDAIVSVSSVIKENRGELGSIISSVIDFGLGVIQFANKVVIGLNVIFAGLRGTVGSAVAFAANSFDLLKGLASGDFKKSFDDFGNAISKPFEDAGEDAGKFQSVLIGVDDTVNGLRGSLRALDNDIQQQSDRQVAGVVAQAVAKIEFQVESSDAFKKLGASLENAGLTQVQIIEKTYADQTKIIRENLSKQLADIDKQQAKLRSQFKDNQSVLTDIDKKAFVARQKIKSDADALLLKAESDLGSKRAKISADSLKEEAELIKAQREKQTKDLKDTFGGEEAFGAITNSISALTKGAEGASDFISGLAGFAADTLLPGIGGVVSDIVSFLAQGPEKVRETINAFFEQIPVVIQAIIESIPALILAILENINPLFEKIAEVLPVAIENALQYFVDNSDRIVESLAAQMPTIGNRFAIQLAIQSPFIAQQFAIAFIKEVPNMAKAFVDAMIDEMKESIKSVFENLNPFGGGGGSGGGGGIGGAVSGAVGAVGDFFGFAAGGEIKGGAPFTDRVPSLLTPGELVVDRDTTNDLKSFLRKQTNESQGVDQNLINQLLQSDGQSQNLTINLAIGEEQLANALININKRGLRTA